MGRQEEIERLKAEIASVEQLIASAEAIITTLTMQVFSSKRAELVLRGMQDYRETLPDRLHRIENIKPVWIRQLISLACQCRPAGNPRRQADAARFAPWRAVT